MLWDTALIAQEVCMQPTTVVFVHGFISTPDCWDPFFKLLEKDKDFAAQGFKFLRFGYPTKFVEMLPQRRIPSIRECGDSLRDFIERQAPTGQIMLVGHSMGGLVIQAYLANKIGMQRATDLERIRTIVTFATPNRGAKFLSTLRAVFSWFREDPQDSELEVLNDDISRMTDDIVRCIIGAGDVGQCDCPIPFQVFWGLQDNVVLESSARGPFVEAHPLAGDHSGIIRPESSSDDRYLALKSALLDPVGHPAIYELDLWDVTLSVSPNDPTVAITLDDCKKLVPVYTDNTAVRQMRFVFSKQNRCVQPWPQMYRSKDGYVQMLSITGENKASKADQSEYRETGKKYTYVFCPIVSDQGQTFAMKLQILNGFGEGQRDWHNHLQANARCKLFRFTLDLRDFGPAEYVLTKTPAMFFFDQDQEDEDLCKQRIGEHPYAPLAADNPWLLTWEMKDVCGGVVDLSWDLKKKAHP